MAKSRDNVSWVLKEIHDYGVNIDSREIFMMPHIEWSEEMHTDFRLSQTFLKNLRILENHNTNSIIVHMQNFGGDWCSGMAIYDAILNSPCYITMIVHGEAMSMGGVILQAADLRVVNSHSTFMMHQGENFIVGTHNQVQSWAKYGETAAKQMVEIFANKCVEGEYFKQKGYSIGQTKAFLTRKMRKVEDWILYGPDTVHFGLADQMIGENGKYKHVNDLQQR